MGGKLIITEINNNIISAISNGQIITDIKCDPKVKNIPLLNDIYIGKVKDVVKNINAAFIELYPGRKGYYPLNENRSPYFINTKNNNKVCIGDEILVQISKDGVKTKDPVLTSCISLAGKLVVITAGNNRIGFSGKFRNEVLKKEIKQAIEPYCTDDIGFIVRTNAQNAQITEIIDEINVLISQLEDIFSIAKHRTCYSKIYSAPLGYLSVIKDSYDNTVEEIITDCTDIYLEIEKYLKQYQEKDLKNLKLYNDPLLPLQNLYSLSSFLQEALNKNIWLKLGGYLVIEPTEAMVVIDVNTGKYVINKNKSEAMLKLNLEAAKQVARQIRIRNLSGIIIVDFVNMEDEEHRAILLAELQKYVSEDPIKTVIVGMTALQLVEITRKKVRKPLHEILSIQDIAFRD